MRFTIKNSSRYARMLEELEPWALLDALRRGVSLRQVASADMINANTCTRVENTLRLDTLNRNRAERVPTVSAVCRGPITTISFEWS